jgi:hypothetical protein
VAVDCALLDIETLGTMSDSAILSVGMVVVDSVKDYEYKDLIENGFYETLDIKTQVDDGRKIYKDTLEWWGTQGEGAGSVLNPSSEDIHWSKLLPLMKKYLLDNGANLNTILVYARGSHFDFSILHDLFKNTGNETSDTLPWKFWNIHDSKTVQITLLDKKIDVKPDGFIHHHALHDAAREYMNVQKAIYMFQETLEDE